MNFFQPSFHSHQPQSSLRTINFFRTINFSFLKLLFFSLLFVFSLSGCFSLDGNSSAQNGDERSVDEQSKVYETQDYSAILPKDWQVIEKDEFTSDIPPETQVVFRNNVKNETFTATVTVVAKSLLEPVSSLEYGKLVHNRESTGLIDFKETQKDTVRIKIGDQEIETLFRVYEGRKAPNESLIRYYETYAVKDNKAYIIAGGVHPRENENVIQTVQNIVKSFQLR